MALSKKEIEKKDRVSTKELASLLNVTDNLIRQYYLDKTFPRKVDKLFSVQEVCDWVLNNSKKRSKLWVGVSRYLGQKRKYEQKDSKSKTAAGESSKPIKLPVVQEVTIPEIPENLSECDDDDFNNILNGFRRTVNYSVRLCEEAASDGNEAMLQARLRTSGQALEQLRKAEQSVLDIQTTRKTLLPADDVKNGYTRLANNVRSKLLQLPVKLSHELVNIQSVGEVQKILNDEIRMILDSFSRNPFGD